MEKAYNYKSYSENNDRLRNDSNHSSFGTSNPIHDLYDHEQDRSNSSTTRDATVKWFNREKGFGFVSFDDGLADAFIHARSIEPLGYQELLPGTKLKVCTIQNFKGPQVSQVINIDDTTASQPAQKQSYRNKSNGYSSYAESDDVEQGWMMGTVKWYNPTKGFGFVSVEDGGKDVFLHRSVLLRAGLEQVSEGQHINLEVSEGPKGREATSVKA